MHLVRRLERLVGVENLLELGFVNRFHALNTAIIEGHGDDGIHVLKEIGAPPPRCRDGNDRYGVRPISFRSECFRIERMLHPQHFLTNGFDGAARPSRLDCGERVLDSTRTCNTFGEFAAEVRAFIGIPLQNRKEGGEVLVQDFCWVSASALL